MAVDNQPKRKRRRNRVNRRKITKNIKRSVVALNSEVETNLKLRKELLAKSIELERMLNLAMETAKKADKERFDNEFEKLSSEEKDTIDGDMEEKKAYLNQDLTAKEKYKKEAMLRYTAEMEIGTLNEERIKVKEQDDLQKKQNQFTAQELAKLEESKEEESKTQQLNCKGYVASGFIRATNRLLLSYRNKSATYGKRLAVALKQRKVFKLCFQIKIWEKYSILKKSIVCLKKKIYSNVPKYLSNKLKIKAIKQKSEN